MKALKQMTNEKLVEFFSNSGDETKLKFYVVGTDDESGYEREISFENLNKGFIYKRLETQLMILGRQYAGQESLFDKFNDPDWKEKYAKLSDEQTAIYKELFDAGVFRSKHDTRQEVLWMDEHELCKYLEGAKAYNRAFWRYLNIYYGYSEDAKTAFISRFGKED